MPSYNISQLQTADNLGKVFIYANDVTGQILMGLVMLAVFFIIFMRLKNWGFAEGLSATSFICFILSLILFYGSLMNLIYVLAFLIITALSLFWLYIDKV